MAHPSKIIYSEGDKIGNYIFLNEEKERQSGIAIKRVAKFRCPCGNEFIDVIQSVKITETRHCRCKRFYGRTEHGQSKLKTSEYTTWCGMKSRCNNPKNQDYHIYGGKGIIVCDQWINSFANFFTDMGKKPSPKHSLERINSNGNYEPSNCKWATQKEQARNTSKNVNITFNGETHCVAEWAEMLGIENRVLQSRLRRWPLADALTTPKVTHRTHEIGTGKFLSRLFNTMM